MGKERNRKPLFMLRSMTVTGADPTRGFGTMRTSKEIQVQDSDFSRQNSRLDLSRKTTEVSFSDLDNPLKESKVYRKTPVAKNRNEFASSRHQSDLNAVAEETEDEADGMKKGEKAETPNKPTAPMPTPQTHNGPMGFGYYNPFDMQGGNQGQYPYPPPGMFYPPMNTPYGPFYPGYGYWGNFPPFQMGQTGEILSQTGGRTVPSSKEKDKKEDSKKIRDSGKNFLKDNKKDARKDVAEKRPKYKDIAAKKREQLAESEEHGEDVRGSDDEDLVQTHTTVKDDNRVKVDINLNISGRQLANMLGNVSTRTMPEIETNREDRKDDKLSSSAPKTKKSTLSRTNRKQRKK